MKLTLIETYSRTDYTDIEMDEEWLEEFKDYLSGSMPQEELDLITLEAIEDYYKDNKNGYIFHTTCGDRVWEETIDDLIEDWKNEFGYDYPVTDTVYGDCDIESDWEVTF